ncbi:MAG: urea transporter [Rhodothermaceae bacterium]|nr:urea transporter [Rhodothermaceae bacterium]
MSKMAWIWQSMLNSYSQIFFSDNRLFAAILVPVTFMDFYAGLFGLMAVLITNLTAWMIGLDTFKISKGYYGFNALLVGLGLGIYFEPGMLLVLIVVIAGILTLLIAVAVEGVIGKYALPHLSLPFVFALWALVLATREFTALGLNERWIYTLNDLYILGGQPLVNLYEWWNGLYIPVSLRSYLLSLGAILFQYSVFSGVLLAIGLLIYSRIAFTLSLAGFYIAWLFYELIGAELSEVNYSYIGFNYILTAIATGGFFVIPNRNSYLSLLVLIPIVAVITVSLTAIMAPFGLPVYALPFNVLVLTYLYALKFRTDNRADLSTLFVQLNSPEKNLYSYVNYRERFGKESPVDVHLPFFGGWKVTQAHDGEYTHKGDWRHAWDFEITDDDGKTFKNRGDFAEDYYCYGKTVIAPADGVVEIIADGIEDNIIGERNPEDNWGNTIVLKHSDFIYSKLSHLKSGSFSVKKGDTVKKGDELARCGNSGNSPYPHLHFQIQSTPYVGSRTLDYPLSNIFIEHAGTRSLHTIGKPAKEDTVSNIMPEAPLRRAFHLIPGKILEFKTDDGEVTWEVKRDVWQNRYIECAATGSKAWFRVDDVMLQFTNFDGDRSALLYYFYLAAYRVSAGYSSGLVIRDTYPVNMVFNPYLIPLQDFVAPFFRYLSGEYTLEYPESKAGLHDSTYRLSGSIIRKIMGRKKDEIRFSFLINNQGICEFIIDRDHRKINATCTEKSASSY